MYSNDVVERLNLPVEVFQAEGKLSALLDIPIEAAVVSLEQWAQLQGLLLADAACRVLRGSSEGETRDEFDDATIATLRRHLGRSCSP